jgi:hypothetical protein
MAAVRHAWLFRAAAIVHLFFGLVWLWRFGLTDYRPEQRVYGLAAGVVAVMLAVMLFRLRRYAIGVSAIGAGIVGISAAVFAPNAKGPVILFLAALAIVCVVYAALAMRAVTRSGPETR